MSSRRAKVVLDLGLLTAMLRGHPLRAVSSDLPADAEIVGWGDASTIKSDREIDLILESASFAEVAEGAFYPPFAPTYTVTMSEADGLLAAMERCPECPNCTGPDHYAAVRGIVR